MLCLNRKQDGGTKSEWLIYTQKLKHHLLINSLCFIFVFLLIRKYRQISLTAHSFQKQDSKTLNTVGGLEWDTASTTLALLFVKLLFLYSLTPNEKVNNTRQNSSSTIVYRKCSQNSSVRCFYNDFNPALIDVILQHG